MPSGNLAAHLDSRARYNLGMEGRGIIYRIASLWNRTARYPFRRAAIFAALAPVALGVLLMGLEVAHIVLFGYTFSEPVAMWLMCGFGAVATLAWFIGFPIFCWLSYCNDPRGEKNQPPNPGEGTYT